MAHLLMVSENSNCLPVKATWWWRVATRMNPKTNFQRCCGGGGHIPNNGVVWERLDN
jgi:hypothetical protein